MPDLTHIQPGDHVAVPRHNGHYARTAESIISHDVYRVTKRTPTLATAIHTEHSHQTIRIRVRDGGLMREPYIYAIEATADIVEQHKTQLQIVRRLRDARAKLSDIEDHPYRVITALSLEQLEALAEAWERIKAMAPAA